LSFTNHFLLMANYNRRLNDQIYKVSANLTKQEFEKDSATYFGSINGTLNHIMVADLLWLARFAQHSERYTSLKELERFPQPKALKEILFSRFIELYGNRTRLDVIIQQWASEETKEEDFAHDLQYSDSQGRLCSRNYGELIAHFFNHQTHHRGQVSKSKNSHC